MRKIKTLIFKKLKPIRHEWFLKIKGFEFQKQEKNLKIQELYLKNIIDYSIKNIPYYEKINQEIKIDLSGNIYEEIKKFPILTKKNLKNNFTELKAVNFKGNYWENSSGGSTGEPAIFLQDEIFIEKGAGAKLLFEDWAGRNNIEDRLIKLWGSERDILKGSIGIKAKISNILNSRKLLNSFMMDEKNMTEYVKIINNFKPKIIEAYVQSIYELARFIKNNNLIIYSPSGIIVSAGTLYPEMKKEIEDVFQTKVLNRYGSREVGDMACSCEKNEGLHLNIFNHYIEILNKELKDCGPGEIGKIYVTTLHNKIMPLIRYDIGDIAVPARSKKCSCGRGMPLIKKVEGREMSMFKTKEGKLVPGEFFIHFVGVVFNKGYISKYQVIQKDFDEILIRVVISNRKMFNNYRAKIESSILNVMGEDCKIEWEFVEEIKPSKSGKYLYTISEIK
jgi:phenylacetate-CoA ligase